MNESTASEKVIRVLQFSGKQKDWRRWKAQFLSRAKIKGYKDAVQGEIVVPAQSEELNKEAADYVEKEQARLKNEQAYNDLILSMTEDVSFGLVDEARSEDLPDGDVAQAWKALLNKYEPKTGSSRPRLKREFHDSKLTDVKNDPEEFVVKLELLRQQLKNMGATISDEDLIIQVLNNLPEEYDNVVESLEDKLDDEDEKLTINDVKDKLRAKYAKIKKRLGIEDDKNEDTDDENNEDALNMRDKPRFRKPFKGTCRNCGKIGHKSFECLENKQNQLRRGNNNRFQRQQFDRSKIRCHYCGIPGHKQFEY